MKALVNGVLVDVQMPAMAATGEQVPEFVSRFQALAVLEIDGQLASVELMVNASDKMTKLAWANATEFRRDSPTIAKIAVVKKWNKAKVDDMFIRASKIKA